MGIGGISQSYVAHLSVAGMSQTVKKTPETTAQHTNDKNLGNRNTNVRRFPDEKNSQIRIPDKTHVHYIRYPKVNDYCIQIVDNKTNKVVLEVPPKQVLDFYVSMMKRFGMISNQRGKVDHS